MAVMDKMIRFRCDDILHGYMLEIAGIWEVTMSEALRIIVFERMKGKKESVYMKKIPKKDERIPLPPASSKEFIF